MNLKSQFTKEKLKKKFIYQHCFWNKQKKKNTNIPFLFSPSLFSRKTKKPVRFSSTHSFYRAPYLSLSLSNFQMYGGSSKLGRGGGAGGVGRGAGAKRLSSSYPLPPTHRPTGGPPSSSRLSLGGRGSGSASNHPRSRSGAGSSAAAPMTEENFSLVSGNNPLAFGMIIRLVPDLVEEIRRVEAQGGTARVKFDANANNSAGNVSFLFNFQLGSASFFLAKFDYL